MANRTVQDSVADPERTIGQLVASASQDLTTIVRGEIELAKAEISATAATAGKGAGLLGGAAVAGLYGLGLLLTAAGWALSLVMPAWAAFLIVAVVLLGVAGVLAFLGKNALASLNPKPERAIANAEATIATLKQAG